MGKYIIKVGVNKLNSHLLENLKKLDNYIHKQIVGKVPSKLKGLLDRYENKKEKKVVGVDCYLYDGKNYYSLDRWYVFEGIVESGKKYTKEQITEKLNSLLDFVKLIKDKKWHLVFLDDKDYYIRWIVKAKELVEKSESDRFYLFTDDNMPEDFYS